jgi:hypothetical protein
VRKESYGRNGRPAHLGMYVSYFFTQLRKLQIHAPTLPKCSVSLPSGAFTLKFCSNFPFVHSKYANEPGYTCTVIVFASQTPSCFHHHTAAPTIPRPSLGYPCHARTDHTNEAYLRRVPVALPSILDTPLTLRFLIAPTATSAGHPCPA